MTQQIFAIMRTRGPRWDDGEPMEGQEDWRAHADYMNALEAEGFMLLAGPLAGTRDVLLIARAQDEAEVEARLSQDCWTVKDLLRTRQINPWSLRLGSLGHP